MKASLGNVRLIDARGRIHHASHADVELQPHATDPPRFGSDGTSIITFVAAFDSSAHESSFLDKITAVDSKVKIQLSLNIDGNVTFSKDLVVVIHHRDARGPSTFMNLFTSQTVSNRVTSLFAVRLTPFLTKAPTDVSSRVSLG